MRLFTEGWSRTWGLDEERGGPWIDASILLTCWLFGVMVVADESAYTDARVWRVCVSLGPLDVQVHWLRERGA